MHLPIVTVPPVPTLTHESLARVATGTTGHRMHRSYLAPRASWNSSPDNCARARDRSLTRARHFPSLSIMIQAMSMAVSRSHCPICDRVGRDGTQWRGVSGLLPPFLRPSVRPSSSPLHSSASERRAACVVVLLCTSWRRQ